MGQVISAFGNISYYNDYADLIPNKIEEDLDTKYVYNNTQPNNYKLETNTYTFKCDEDSLE